MNVDPESVTRDTKPLKTDYNITDSDPEEVSEELTMMITKLLFIHAFYELKASEYSSRMVAMKNATDSAKKMSRKKILQLNKERQAVITQQISEIVAGSL
jgi:F-type H+-transporting ATPase subunit gamma